MNLETILKHFSPKGLSISDSSPATASDALNITDIMAALGMTQSGAEFGLRLFLAKAGISQQDKTIAVGMLTQYAKQHAPKHIGKVAGRRMAECLRIMAKMAFEDYARSAAATSTCPCCSGTGLTKVKRTFRNQLAIDRQHLIDSLPGNLGLLYRDEMKSKKEGMEIHDVLCRTCNGKGVISARCRCNGTGRVRDLEKSNLLGVPVDKTCERCAGRGFKRTPSSTAYTAITALLPELTQSSWSRNWKGLYELLVTKCEQEENHANTVFQRITSR
ncbi:antitermination protein [Rahnella aquatilis]|nr:antitermination protein [Rahnella aquatilis]